MTFTDLKMKPATTGGDFKLDTMSVSNYYSFGMLEPERWWVSKRNKLCYGYNGKERDDEVKGKGNSYDYGARIYDPRLGRFLSLDPKMKEYPFLSPYVYTADNPIMFIDKDGRDYALYINHNEHTIIVKATIYTVEYSREKDFYHSKDDALNTAKYWYNQNGKFKYAVKEGDKQLSYSINFEINVVTVDMPDLQFNVDRSDFEGDLPKLVMDKSSNTYLVKAFYEGIFRGSKDESYGGIKQDGTRMFVKSTVTGTDAGAHELGHALGISEHSQSGIMTKTLNSKEHSSELFPDDIQAIIDNALKPGINPKAGGATGTIMPQVGEPPANFNNGTVEKEPGK